MRGIAAAAALGALTAGCSDTYLDRRETVSFAAGDAVASNRAVQTIDPWPPASANRNIRVQGNVVAAGIERYRTGRVIPPRGNGTSSSGYGGPAQQQAPAATTSSSTP